MKKILLLCSVAFLLLEGWTESPAQLACHFGGQANQLAMARQLTDAPSCKAASQILNRCRWGSSADADFGNIVRDKCEQAFLSRLTPEQLHTYTAKLHLCSYQLGGQEGTISISEDWVCQANVAAEYVANPLAVNQPVPSASFDCTKAASPLEKTICTHPALGDADIIMSRAYKPFVKALTEAERPVLIQSQRAWNKSVANSCNLNSLPVAPMIVKCLVERYEKRAHDLDGCSMGLDLGCVKAVDEEEQKTRAQAHP